MDSEAYLEPDFDPNTLRVADLRGILLKHDVDYPSSAKKAVLVELFNEHITPRSQNLLSASARVIASDEGMINAGFTPEKNEIGATPRRVRRSTRGVTEDTTDEETASRSTRNTKGRTPSRRRVSEAPEDMPPPPPTVRKTRKSMAPRVMDEDVATPRREVEGAPEEPDTPFSSVNPFQMGSPPVFAKTPDPDKRRTTVGVPSTSKKPSASLRRRTDGVSAEPIRPYNAQDYPSGPQDHSNGAQDYSSGSSLPKRRQSSRTPVNGSKLIKSEPVDDDNQLMNATMEPGEEFAPQEAMELAQEPQQELARRPQSSGGSGNALLVIVLTVLLAYAGWWRTEKLEIGYCGVGGLDMRKHESNAFMELVRPDCEPCPPHARCYPGMELECIDDYIKVNSYLSLGGLWPIPPACVPDSEKERRVMIMSDAALDVLRKSGAEQRCKEKFLSGGMELEGVSEVDLRQVLYDRKAASLSDREFSELWRHALEDVSNREEVIVETDTDGSTKLKSTSIAALPFGCAARLFIAGSLARHRVEIIGVILLLIAGFNVRSTLEYKKSYNSKVTKLVHIALSQLAVNAIQHPEQPFIAVAHLRDQVLQEEFNPKTRKHLWTGVEKIVEQNSNIRAGEREIQGEIMRVWTWIGGRFVEGKSVFDEGPLPAVKQEPIDWTRTPRPVV